MKLVPLADRTRARRGSARGEREPARSAWRTWSSPGSSSTRSQARISLFHVPDRPGYAARVFRSIADAGVFVDMIVQNVGIDGDSAALVHRAARGRPSAPSRPSGPPGVADVSVEPAMAKLSVIGVGMRTHTGVATRMFAALAERGINVNLINTSEVRINVGTDIDRGREGLECLKQAFAL